MLVDEVNQAVYRKAGDVIASGGVIAYPTEYCYGLGCDIFALDAVARILAIKQRPADKGLIVIANDMQQLDVVVSEIPLSQYDNIIASWPGPHTWLLPVQEQLSPLVRGQHDLVAIRIPEMFALRQLLHAVGRPIISTSANRAGEPELRSFAAVQQEFAGVVDYIVPGSVGNATAPSSIRNGLNGERIR